MVKIRAEAEAANINLTDEDFIAEACAAHNTLLTYYGYTPFTGVCDIEETVDLFDMANSSPDADALCRSLR
eukprot:15618210-Heterocapsa_arctica.AAC.1